MADIKTRDKVKGTIKTIDKAAVASERMKNSYVKAKNKAEHGFYADENSTTEYATDKASGATEHVIHEGIHQFDKQGRKGVKETKENIGRAKDKISDFKHKRAVKTAESKTAQPGRHSVTVRNEVTNRSPARSIKSVAQTEKSIKTSARSIEKTIKQSVRSTGKTVKTAKGTIKTAEKGIKTAKASSKAAIKTTQQAAKAAQAAAKTAAKAAQKAAQAAKAAAKATVTAIKVAIKATIAAVKAIIAGTKALIAAIAAGGWVAVAVIVIVCIIGLLLGSVFGIFFSGEDSGTSITMQTVVREINTEYDDKLEKIKNDYSV